MGKQIVVGILREKKNKESRAALSPQDVRWLRKRSIDVEVESSTTRVFKDSEYKKAGAKIVNRLKDAQLLVGVKKPKMSALKDNRIYMFFSHTIKGQKENRPLLKACVKKGITLIDYERIVDKDNKRLAYFGRFAGIAGCVDGLSYLGAKYAKKGIKNPFTSLNSAIKHKTYTKAKKEFKKLKGRINARGFDKRISPFIVGITGFGNVGRGVVEMLKSLSPEEIHPKDLKQFIKEKKWKKNKVYYLTFHREQKLRKKDGKGFYFEEYLNTPKKFESNMEQYLPFLNILFHTSYWDKQFPRLVSKKMVHKICKNGSRLEFIGDLSCDTNGSVELNYKTTSEENPVYTYNPGSDKYRTGVNQNGISILARDNLPSEMPKDASITFSLLIRDYVYQIAVGGEINIAHHEDIPREVRNAVITQNHKLTKPYDYLKKYIS